MLAQESPPVDAASTPTDSTPPSAETTPPAPADTSPVSPIDSSPSNAAPEQPIDQSTVVQPISPPSDQAFGSPTDQGANAPFDLSTKDNAAAGGETASSPPESPAPANEGETKPGVGPAVLEQVPGAETLADNPTIIQDSIAVSAVLNSDETIGDPANINEQSVVEIKTEQEKLDGATTPQEATNILIDSAGDKVRDINKFLKSDDLASMNFAALRLTDQINEALERIQNLPISQLLPLKAQIANFCKSADFSLRNLELGVTEESEPDLEIARGACLGTQL